MQTLPTSCKVLKKSKPSLNLAEGILWESKSLLSINQSPLFFSNQQHERKFYIDPATTFAYFSSKLGYYIYQPKKAKLLKNSDEPIFLAK